MIASVLASVTVWLFAEILIIILFILDGLVNIFVSFLSFVIVWLMNQLNVGAAEWLAFPVIVSFFQICRSIGVALFAAGVLYSVTENLMNYNSGQGLTAFRSTFFNITKALIAVSLFTVIPPLMFRWSIELTGLVANVDWNTVLDGSFSYDVLYQLEGLEFAVPDLADGERLIAAVSQFFNLLFRLINLIFIAWGVYRLALAAMHRLGTIMVLTARMAFTFFSFARGMSDGFTKAAMDVLGVCVIMFIQMYLLLTAVAHTDRNPLLVWGLIMVSAKVDQILQFGMDPGSRTSALSTLHSAIVIGGAFRRPGRGAGGKGTMSGSAS